MSWPFLFQAGLSHDLWVILSSPWKALPWDSCSCKSPEKIQTEGIAIVNIHSTSRTQRTSNYVHSFGMRIVILCGGVSIWPHVCLWGFTHYNPGQCMVCCGGSQSIAWVLHWVPQVSRWTEENCKRIWGEKWCRLFLLCWLHWWNIDLDWLTSQQRRTPLRLELEGRNLFVGERVSLALIVRQYLTSVGGYWISQLSTVERHLTAWLMREVTSSSSSRLVCCMMTWLYLGTMPIWTAILWQHPIQMYLVGVKMITISTTHRSLFLLNVVFGC